MKILRETNDSLILQCAFCTGTGAEPKSDTDDDDYISSEPCSVCSGKGVIINFSFKDQLLDCALCEGTGKKWDSDFGNHFCGETCVTCGGRGFVNLFQDYANSDEYLGIHPIIREISKTRFDSKNYADGIEASLKYINNCVKQIVFEKTVSEQDGSALMNRAFSLQNPIIKLNSLESQSEKDEQIGYMQIFSGAMTGIRNPKAHGLIDISQERAKHLLFLCSLLMYRIEERILEEGA